jgi:hypothetical protein
MNYNIKKAMLFTSFELNKQDIDKLDTLTKYLVKDTDIEIVNKCDMNNKIIEFVNSEYNLDYKYLFIANVELEEIDDELYNLINEINSKNNNGRKRRSNKDVSCTVAIVNFDREINERVVS